MNNNSTQQKDNRKTIYAILIAALVLTWGYILYDKSKAKEALATANTQTTVAVTSRDSIKAELDKAELRSDSITSSNVQLQGALADRNSEILKLKSNVRTILNKKNATDEELKQARVMIKELNGKIDDLFAEVTKLKSENAELTATNQQLNTDKTQLTTEKKNLETNLNNTQTENKKLADKVDVASTLHASNIGVAAVTVKRNGKEKETSNAKKADMFVIACTLDENRVTPSGTKLLYVCVYNPDGSPSGVEGTFTTREGDTKPYTNKVEVNYEQGKATPVSFNWKPGEHFQTGDYKIEIYNNGFKIGEGKKTLKKSGFLGL
jgi:predicted  nucleic acid-binding Zn-ribbon protein